MSVDWPPPPVGGMIPATTCIGEAAMAGATHTGRPERAARLLADAPRPVVILPGNHDPLTPDSVYRRGGLAEPVNVTVLGLPDDAVVFPALDLEIWGHAHRDYNDMAPLRDPRPRTT